MAVEAHGEKGRRCDEEGPRDARLGVDEEDSGKRQTGQAGIPPEGRLRCAQAHLVDAKREEQIETYIREVVKDREIWNES